MNLNKYINTGWGLSRKAFELLEKNILEISQNKIQTGDMTSIRVIEFGSGISTQFLVDIKYFYNLDIKITSFDNDINYCFKSKQIYPFLSLKIRNLMECSDVDYIQMFVNKEYNKQKMYLRKEPTHTRQKNCFYDILDSDINGYYDLVIIDGPNGNGRNFVYLALKDHLKSNTKIFIDDFDHYDFVDKLKLIFDCNELYSQVENDRKNKWYTGGHICLYEIV